MPPIDIKQLRANIGDDAETERALLSLFIESSEESLRFLQQAFPAAEDETYNQEWKSRMHQIKGAALNINAPQLTRLASLAQSEYRANSHTKQMLLKDVASAFAEVKSYVRELEISARAK